MTQMTVVAITERAFTNQSPGPCKYTRRMGPGNDL